MRVTGDFSILTGSYFPTLGHPVVLLVDVSDDAKNRFEYYTLFSEGSELHGERVGTSRNEGFVLDRDFVREMAKGRAEQTLRRQLTPLYHKEKDLAYLRPLNLVEASKSVLMQLWLAGDQKESIKRVHKLTNAQSLIDYIVFIKTSLPEIDSNTLT